MRILVTSHAGFSDVWGPFQALLARYWPDRPWEAALVTDRARPGAWTAGPVFEAGEDRGYPANLSRALGHFGDPEILLLMEDFLLYGPVETAFVERALGILRADPAAAMFRLMPCPGADVEIPGNPDYGLIGPKAPYRVSCMAALWKTETLLCILEGRKTAWDFELSGSEFAKSLGQTFLSVRRDRSPWPVPHLATAVTRGEWEPGAIALMERHGIRPGALGRPVRKP